MGNILGPLLMTLGMLMVFLYTLWVFEMSSFVYLFSLLFIYVVGVHFFFAAAFTCLFMSVPVEYVGVVNTVNAVGFMLGSMLESYLFGIIADATGSYADSIFM